MVNESCVSLKGKRFSCVEASISLSPCPTSLKALSSLCLVGKVIAPMHVDVEDIDDLVTRVWKKNVSIVSLSGTSSKNYFFRFGFINAVDREWALEHGPWTVRGYSLALKDWSPSVEGPASVECLRVWVQVHNLPHEYYSDENATLLGGLVGKVVKCGRLGHQRRGCSLSSPVTVDNGDGTPFPMFGPWLSAASKLHDVFSSARDKLLEDVISGSLLRLSGRSSSVAGNVVGKSVSCPRTSESRGSRRFKKVTSRTRRGQGQRRLLAWKPKSVPEEGGETFASNGNGVTSGLNFGEKSPALFPSLEAAIQAAGGPLPNNLNACDLSVAIGPKVWKDKEHMEFSSHGQEAHLSQDEDKALAHFFQAQETTLQELKKFGSLDLYEIRSLGGDIGVSTASEINARSTPFKKRKFEASFSVCSRPYKFLRRHLGVIRDFLWDGKEQDNASKVVLEDPSEDPSDTASCSDGVKENHFIGSFVIDDSVSGQTSTVLELKSLVRLRSPDFVFISELKVDAAPLVRILHSLHFYFHIYVPESGTAGGIILAWKLGFSFECITCTRNNISGIVYSDPPTHPWLLSCVYGPSYFHAKKTFWAELVKLGDKFGGAWLIMGDTNFVLRESDREGSISKDQFIPFITGLVESRGLVDMPIQGDRMTWDNHRSGLNHVKSALDKCLVDEEWLCLFPKAAICSYQTSNSDHRPLCLFTEGLGSKFKRSFKFEEGWTRNERNKFVVAHAWRSVAHPWAPARVFKKIGATRIPLSQWHRAQYGCLDSRIKNLENNLNLLQSLPAGDRDWNTECSIRRELNEARERKSLYWKQRARISWIKEGDKCSKFFFLSATIRGRWNAIESIMDKDNNWITSRELIGREFIESFRSTFAGSGDVHLLNCNLLIHENNSEEEKKDLILVPNNEEIRNTLFSMNSHKAPGPDGMSILFFKHYWDAVGDDFCETVTDFFATSKMHKGVNATNIVLIPKV
uniref:DUF4283 domain-containing protein n=1 Tax=Cannabis sativa TaxID=3483 RepID=A0A803QHI3_CANSA